MPGLYLSSLNLSHFRSHLSATLTLDERPVAIFGPNGAGKTNILEAVSLFSPGRGLRRGAAADMARRPESMGWKLRGVLQSMQQVHEVEIWSEDGQARQLRIDEKTSSQSALARIARILWLVPAMDRLWIEGAEGRRRFLDRITLSFIPTHADASLVYEKAMRERNRLLKDNVRDGHWYVAVERQMAEAGIAIHTNRQAALKQLQSAQKEAETSFPAADLDLTVMEGEMPRTEQEFRDALSENRFRDLAAGRSLIGPHRADLYSVYAAKGVPARDCSTGEQKALLVSLILSNARALKRDFGAAPIILLDEVAAHLDASRRAALYDEICALGSQAWMTGTGSELFYELHGRAQFFEVTDAAGTSDMGPVPM